MRFRELSLMKGTISETRKLRLHDQYVRSTHSGAGSSLELQLFVYPPFIFIKLRNAHHLDQLPYGNCSRNWVLRIITIDFRIQDLGSMLSFLQVCRPLDDPEFFKRLLLRPLKLAEPAGVELLRVRSATILKKAQLAEVLIQGFNEPSSDQAH